MTQDKKRRGPPLNKKPAPTTATFTAELANQKARIDELRVTVNRLKDILQVQDNWHSRTAKMIGQRVLIVLDAANNIGISTISGELLWTDRYNVGVSDASGELIINKGHLVTLKLA